MAKKLAAAGALIAAIAATPAQAIVGASREEAQASTHVVMLLKSDAHGAGFCSASVIAPDALVTAAHCVAEPDQLRVYWPGGEPGEIAAVRKHPLYRRDAPRTRVVSIDLALVRLKRPLPASFTPVPIAWDPAANVGARFLVVGYGLTREGDGRTGGRLRAGELAIREPLSKILLWGVDPAGRGLGACTGDSGGPFLTADGGALAAVTVWSQGAGAKHCGALTQAVRLGPQRDFIEKTLQDWAAR